MSTGPPAPPPRTIQFKCVKCGQPIRVNHSATAVQVACPKCELLFAILPDGQIIRQDNADAFDSLPPAVVSDVAPPRAKGFRADLPPAPVEPAAPSPGGQVYHPINPRTKGATSNTSKMVRRIIGVSVALCFACLIVGGIGYLIREYGTEDTITRVMASMESPQDLWNEVISHGVNAVAGRDELIADQELDRASLESRTVAAWDRSRAKLSGLRKRATYLEPISQSQLNAYLRQVDPAMQKMLDSVTDPGALMVLSPSAEESWSAYREEFLVTVNRIAILSAPLPENVDLKSSVARQAAGIERKIYVQAARMDPHWNQGRLSDRDPLDEAIAQAVLDYREIAEKLGDRLVDTPIIEDVDLLEPIRNLNYRNLFPVSIEGSSEIEEALTEARIAVLGGDVQWTPSL